MADNTAPPGLDEFLAMPTEAETSEAPQGLNEFIAPELQEEKYGGIGQQLKTFAEGAASAATFGLSTGLETAAGVKPEDIRGRQEENPISHGAGQVAGIVGTSLIPGGAEAQAVKGAGMAAKAFNPLSAASVLTRAGEMGASALGVGKTAAFADQVAASATKAAFEGALFQAGTETSRGFTQQDLAENPAKFAETALINIGMTGVLTGMFGGALGAASQALKKSAPTTFISSADNAAHEAGDLKTLISADETLTPAKKQGLLDAFNVVKKKENAAELKAAKDLLGLPETPGMYLESPLVQTHVDALANSPYTVSGNKVRGQLDEAHGAVERALDDATASANKLSKEQLGESLKNSLTEETRTAYAPQKAAFEELGALHSQVPVKPNDIIGLRNALQEIKEVKLGPSTDEGKLVRQILKTLENAKTAEDLSTIRNMSALKNPGVGKDPLGWIKGIIRDRLVDTQEDAVRRYAKSFPRNDEAGALMASMVERAEATKAGYKPYIKKLGELSEWLGKGKIHGTEDALQFMNERLTASDVAQRLFSSSKDPAFLKFFSKEFPQQFGLIRDYQRMAMREAATTGEEFSAKRFFNKFNKLEPEVQNALYSKDEIKRIAASETYIRDAFPKNFNPSGTAHMMAHRLAHETPKSMILANARDYAMEKFINLAGNYDAKNAAELAKATVKGEKALKNSVIGIFSKVNRDTMTGASVATRDKLNKLVSEYQAQPDRMLKMGDNNPVPEYNTAFAAAASRTVSYLSSLRPDTMPKSPLDSKMVASNQQKSEYNRALDLAEQPLRVLDHISKGTLTPKDVIGVATMYPALYNKMVSQINDEMIKQVSKGNKVPYKKRMALSTFLAQPLDSTLTPQGIVGAQPEPSAPPQGQQPPPKRGTASLSKLPGQYQTPSQARDARQNKN